MRPQPPVGPPPGRFQAGIPSFIGAASRKKKQELAAELGMSMQGDGWHVAQRPQAWGPAPGRGKVVEPLVRAAPSQPLVRAAPSRTPVPTSTGKRPAQAARPSTAYSTPSTTASAPSAIWITLDDDSPFVLDGMTPVGPVVSFSSELQPLMSSSHDLLSRFLGDLEQVTLTEDADWQLFPEVGAAIKAAGGEELSMCMAQTVDPALWAVGLGSKWKAREQAARLSLALALAAATGLPTGLEGAYPAFIALCEQCGDVDAPPSQGRVSGGQARRPTTPPRGKRRLAYEEQQLPVKAERFDDDGITNSVAAGEPLPRDRPLWIHLAAGELPGVLQGSACEGLVLSMQGKGSSKPGLYSSAAKVLEIFMTEEAELHDDPNWDNLPEIGAALKEISTVEECLTVAISREHNVWGVGVCTKGKGRYAAAKAALAVAVAVQLHDLGEEPDLSEYPALASLVEEAREARE